MIYNNKERDIKQNKRGRKKMIFEEGDWI